MTRAPDRPRLHFTAPRGWLNDPNGLVHVDGVHHLFFQHQPDTIDWGPMHWGHAVSRDLVTWDSRPIALAPDPDGVAFSGCAVQLDDGTLAAVFTNVADDGTQDQRLAVSEDGDTWVRHPGNPVLTAPAGERDFRDPKVFRHHDGWVMVLAVGHEVQFFASPDLLRWTPTGHFGRGHGAHGGVWETPDLLRFGDRWVLTVSVWDGGPSGGSGTQYFVGSFDGGTFRCADDPARIRWVDHGPDFYAPQSWHGLADGRVTWLAWMSNWAYAGQVPADSWRGVMTVARDVSLVDVGDDVALAQRPVVPAAEVVSLELDAPVELLPGVELGYDEKSGELVLDRSGAWPLVGASVIRTPLASPERGVQVVTDTCSVEVFADDGRVVVTALAFPAS